LTASVSHMGRGSAQVHELFVVVVQYLEAYSSEETGSLTSIGIYFHSLL